MSTITYTILIVAGLLALIFIAKKTIELEKINEKISELNRKHRIIEACLLAGEDAVISLNEQGQTINVKNCIIFEKPVSRNDGKTVLATYFILPTEDDFKEMSDEEAMLNGLHFITTDDGVKIEHKNKSKESGLAEIIAKTTNNKIIS